MRHLPLAPANRLSATVGGSLALAFALPALGQEAAQALPNVVFVLCDDMGWGDLGCYGQHYIHTPNIDRLASEGMQFMQAYAGSPVSAPSRASLMTGQHTGHCEIRGNREYWPESPAVMYGDNKDYSVVGQHPLDTAHVALTEVMRSLGYRTGMFGKWALGYEGSASTPDKRGVEEYYGPICQFQAHAYYPNFLNRYSEALGDTGVVREVLEGNIGHAFFGDDYYNRPEYSADLIHRRAMEWLDRQEAGRPFFGLLTYTLPHAELVQPEDSILAFYKQAFSEDKDFGGAPGSWYHAVSNVHAQFAGMITRLDAYVGEIMAKLRERGLDSNTIVIFSSDNGPHEEGGGDPSFFNRDGVLRGIKRSCHEGGIRVPFIVWWPGHVEAGVRSDKQIAFCDVMPTLCELAGAGDVAEAFGNPRLGEADRFDGISFLPTLVGEDERQREHDYLYWEFDETDQIAVRKGNWKLIVKQGRPELYDLAGDVHEDHDVAPLNPEKVSELVGIIGKAHTESPYFHVTLPAQLQQQTNPKAEYDDTH